uniref:Uncharacterized protein n=1 Tax=Arundo donax TaxID=35708 RepID=A0A0A9GNK7_ARUDO
MGSILWKYVKFHFNCHFVYVGLY